MSSHDDATRRAPGDREANPETEKGGDPAFADDMELRYDVAGAALGSLSRDEEMEVLAAAEADPALAAELAEMQAVASALARLAPSEQINRGRSAGMRSRLITRAAASRAGRPVERQPVSAERVAAAQARQQATVRAPEWAGTSGTASNGGTTAARHSGQAHRVPYEPRTGWTTGARALAFLALAATVAFVSVGVQLWRVERAGQQPVRAVASRDSSLATQVAELRASVQARDSVISALTGQQTKVIDLVSYSTRDPMARMFWDQSRQRWTMYASHLKRPAQGYTYQLWLVARGHAEPISAGTFNPDTTGAAVMSATYALAPGALMRVVVTEEPDGGMPAPTGQVAFSGSVN